MKVRWLTCGKSENILFVQIFQKRVKDVRRDISIKMEIRDSINLYSDINYCS